MTTRPSRRPSLGGALVAGVLGAVAGVLGAVAGGLLGAPAIGAEASGTALPLATSVQTSAGTWATVAMGDLGQPLNTFWQLFYEPPGSSTWSNQVEATATATNGGLVLGAEGPSVLVGVRPSDELRFSPLITSSDGGRSWSNGVLFSGLAPSPDALALAPGQAPLALVAEGSGAAVERSSGSVSNWRTLVTQGALARGPGRRCRILSLTAVGYDGSEPLVGASCARAGALGLFEEEGTGWRPVGPSLPPAGAGPAQVVAITGGGASPTVLIRLARASGSTLLAARATAGDRWQLSPPLALGAGGRLLSVGQTGSGGLFALTSRGSALGLFVLSAAGVTWSALPAPPPGTATVVFGPGGGAQALAVHRSTLQVWSLGAGAWSSEQVLHVPVQYGSSS